MKRPLQQRWSPLQVRSLQPLLSVEGPLLPWVLQRVWADEVAAACAAAAAVLWHPAAQLHRKAAAAGAAAFVPGGASCAVRRFQMHVLQDVKPTTSLRTPLYTQSAVIRSKLV